MIYLEDLHEGQRFRSTSVTITADEIRRFAAEFDPQPFHLDDEAAAATLFRGLAASGWHTAALTMRLLVQGGVPIAGGLIGAGVDELLWPRPTRPGDTLTVDSEVLSTRQSRSRPAEGIAKIRSTTRNQNEEPVQILVANLIVPRRTAAA